MFITILLLNMSIENIFHHGVTKTAKSEKKYFKFYKLFERTAQ